jgi:hypothetical protein
MKTLADQIIEYLDAEVESTHKDWENNILSDYCEGNHAEALEIRNEIKKIIKDYMRQEQPTISEGGC